MTDDDGTLDTESCESLSEQISLSGGRPHGAPRPIAIPKTWAVKRENVTLPPTGEVEQSAQIEILGSDDITMEKDYWPPPALLKVVELSTLDGNKPPARWVLPLYVSCLMGVPQSHASNSSGR
jgi:hypothetical protein